MRRHLREALEEGGSRKIILAEAVVIKRLAFNVALGSLSRDNQ
jgi:hypothetical protein